MNKMFNLTKEGLLNNWNQKKTLIIFALAILLIASIVYLYISYSKGGNDHKINESRLPAIKVRVLNGCAYDRLATEYAEYISEKNIEVVELGDTPRPIYDKSIILVRRLDEKDLQRLQKMTGIKRYTFVFAEDAKADFDIIIGRDFEDFMK